MKPVSKKNCSKIKKLQKGDRGLTVFAAALSLFCAMLCALMSLDCEKYTSFDRSVQTSITYEEPIRATEKGFWDIFCESVMGLLSDI